ncbi:hypothetical protein SAY86_020996 [Trapa natans]|uniref:Uncharacterized protein n=1 Tax=Trapa natans TaxID=22666 RepID=A0AAN7RCR6_TRANT|nr:hypothetical protein SAY86_020996 [Trapa natans]
MLEPHHFSDYGFDPQIDFFQVLGEARRHKREVTRPIDSIHFKLQKPISKDHHRPPHLKKRKWWRNALLFFRGRWAPQITHHTAASSSSSSQKPHCSESSSVDSPLAGGGSWPMSRASIPGRLYLTESRSDLGLPYRTASQPTSGSLGGSMTPFGKGDLGISYLNLRQTQRFSTSATAPPW